MSFPSPVLTAAQEHVPAHIANGATHTAAATSGRRPSQHRAQLAQLPGLLPGAGPGPIRERLLLARPDQGPRQNLHGSPARPARQPGHQR